MLFKATVTASSLHVRQGPGSSYDSLGFVHMNDVLAVHDLDGSGTWVRVETTVTGEGWCSAKYLRPSADGNAFPWLAIAAAEVGVREYPGASAHPRILQYLASVDNLGQFDRSSDETAWCSCFMNWCVERSQINGTNSAWARSWHNWRQGLDDRVAIGPIAVFERNTPNAHGGHVGICVAQSDDQMLLLGGNQSNAVRYQWYPLDGTRGNTSYRLLSLRGL